MNIELQAAAELLRSTDLETYIAAKSWSKEFRAMAVIAQAFLSTDPITPEWLREKWGDAGPDGEYQAYFYQGRVWIDENNFVMNQGQFTALMFSLGQYPKV